MKSQKKIDGNTLIIAALDRRAFGFTYIILKKKREICKNANQKEFVIHLNPKVLTSAGVGAEKGYPPIKSVFAR